MSPSISSEPAAAGIRSSRIAATFETCAADRRAALVLYATAGYPSPAAMPEVLRTIADAGADVIELGVPFSDPLADGPVIQAASNAAIAQGVDLRWVLDALASFRAVRDTPVVLFSYLNPLLRFGVDRFLEEAVAAGADGVLVTDLPLGGDAELEALFEQSALDLVRLVAPTSTPERARAIAAASRGFVYYVSRTGVTGEQAELSGGLEREVSNLRRAAEVPVAVGFGISDATQAAAVARIADGVVVGSALVRKLGDRPLQECGRFVEGLRAAMQR
jgi:tryptophan synthase alpha chain